MIVKLVNEHGSCSETYDFVERYVEVERDGARGILRVYGPLAGSLRWTFTGARSKATVMYPYGYDGYHALMYDVLAMELPVAPRMGRIVAVTDGEARAPRRLS